MALTDKEIQVLKPQAKRYEVFDGEGLYLLVHPNATQRAAVLQLQKT